MAKGICSVEGCDRPHKAHGWCSPHYRRWQRHGDAGSLVIPRRTVTPRLPKPKRTCSLDGCDKTHLALGLCAVHRDRKRAEERRAAWQEAPSLPGERWLAIPGYEGVYEVSDHGRVRSLTREIVHSDGHRSVYLGKLIRPQVAKAGGYHLVRLSVNSVGETVHIHRAVMSAFVGPPPEALQVCHNDGDPTNNRLGNLRYDTASANQQDKVRHGRHHNTNKPACPQDHLYQAPNLTSYSVRHGIRACRTCALTDSARRKAVRDGHAFDPRMYAEQKYKELMERAHDPHRRMAP